MREGLAGSAGHGLGSDEDAAGVSSGDGVVLQDDAVAGKGKEEAVLVALREQVAALEEELLASVRSALQDRFTMVDLKSRQYAVIIKAEFAARRDGVIAGLLAPPTEEISAVVAERLQLEGVVGQGVAAARGGEGVDAGLAAPAAAGSEPEAEIVFDVKDQRPLQTLDTVHVTLEAPAVVAGTDLSHGCVKLTDTCYSILKLTDTCYSIRLLSLC